MPPSGSGARGDGDIPQPRVAQKERGCVRVARNANVSFTLATFLRSPARSALARLARAGDRAAAGGFSCPGRDG